MAVTPVPAFTPTAYATLPVTSTSSNVELPTTGTPDAALLTNAGPNPVAVLQGDDTVVVTADTGLIILAGQSIYVAITGTYLAAVTLNNGPAASALYIAVGS